MVLYPMTQRIGMNPTWLLFGHVNCGVLFERVNCLCVSGLHWLSCIQQLLAGCWTESATSPSTCHQNYTLTHTVRPYCLHNRVNLNAINALQADAYQFRSVRVCVCCVIVCVVRHTLSVLVCWRIHHEEQIACMSVVTVITLQARSTLRPPSAN